VLVLAAVISPLLLPLLIPAAIVWFLVSRARRNRARQQAV
jgi:preprotein translocase subunit YajC